MHIDIRIGAVGDPPLFPEINSGPAKLVGVCLLQAGMTSGRTSAAFIFETPDGKHYTAELSAQMAVCIGSAARGAMQRFGDPDQ